MASPRLIAKHAPTSVAWPILQGGTIAAGLVFLFAGTLYALTAAPTVTWQNGGNDSGELVTASYTLGIAHPPGYPLYILLGKAWSHVPLGEIAHRYSLFSALCAALAAAVVSAVVVELCRHHMDRDEETAHPSHHRLRAALAGAAGGLSLATAPAFWAQATVPEVYALNALVVATALWLVFCWAVRQAPLGRVTLLAAAALTVGLGTANHLTTVFLLPTLGLYVIVLGRRTVSCRRWLLVAAAAAAGLTLYVYLPLRAAPGNVANWGDPSTVARFVHHVTGGDYQGYLLALPASQVVLRFPVIARLLVEQFTWPGLVLILLGGWHASRRERSLLLALVVLYTVFALLYNAEGSQVYLLPAYVVLAVFLGLGVDWLYCIATPVTPAWRAPLLGGLVGLTLLVPMAKVALGYGAVDASANYEARDYALRRLQSAAAAEPIYTSTDEETFPLWYAQAVLGVRPEVPIVNRRLLRLAWYREHLTVRYPGYRLPGEHPE